MDAARRASEQQFFDQYYGREPSTAFNGYFENSAGARRYRDLLQQSAPGKRVIEFGCGSGAYATLIARSGAASVTAIDISATAIERARERIPPELRNVIDARVADAEALDFPDRSFDVACGAGIIHHLDTERATREIHRVLKPGGRAIFYEPLGYNPLLNAYRKLTPNSHTPDEHPLKNRDFAIFRSLFPSANIEFYDCLALAAIAVMALPGGKGVQRALEIADRVLFTVVPPLRLWATMVVVNAQK